MMKKLKKVLTRLPALLLCLAILLPLIQFFPAAAETGIIDPQTFEGTVILEDPALLGEIEDETESTAQVPVSEPSQPLTSSPAQEPSDNPTVEPTTLPTTPPAAVYEIVMTPPTGWYAGRAAMEVIVTDLGGTGWTDILVTMETMGSMVTLLDGPIPSGHFWLDILDNCSIEVTVTDPYGGLYAQQADIFCFDHDAPTLKAGVKGEYLHIEASDTLSGIRLVQVNGTQYTNLTDGQLDIHLKEYADAYEQLLVQAVDKVGNPSKAIAVANPFFHNTPTAAPTATPKPTNTPKPTKHPSGGVVGNNSNPGNSATPTPTVEPTPAPTVMPPSSTMPILAESGTGYPFTAGGNSFTRDLLYDKFTNKQFIAIETRSGDVFYMVIDYDKPLDEKGERYETYFLNLVDNRDLLDIVDTKDIPDEPGIVYASPEPTPVPTPAPALDTEEAPKKDSGSSTLGMIGILLAAVGGALWYFKFRKPKQGGKGKPGFDEDYDFDEDEETDNEDK